MSAESRSERQPRLRSAEPWDHEDESSEGKARHRAEESAREPRERTRKSEDDAAVRPRRPAWLSPLTLRILAINVLVLAIPVLGLLHLGQYRQSLIAAELDALILQGRTFTLPLANSAVSVSVSGEESLEAEPTRQLMRVLLTSDRLRARVFDRRGVMIGDSNLLSGPGGTVEVRELPAPSGESNLGERIERVPESLLEWLPGQGELPLYREPRQPTARDYPEVEKALQGQSAGRARSDTRGRLVLSAAVPVQRYRQVLGALMLSKDGAEIAAAVADRRHDVLVVFAIGFAVTVLLSLYLAGTIARPVRRLAEAAEAVRYGKGRRIRIPDLTKRADEIGDLSGALIDMTEALWQRLDAIEGFAADVAHEIKNPLTSLRSAVETASRIQDPEQQKKLMSIILDDVARLDRLISDISDASRLDAELSRAQTQPVDVAHLVHTLADVNTATAAFGKPRLVIDLPARQDLYVAGIEDRLGQVLRNLLSNAATFSPPSGRIELAARREGPSVVVTVSDQGPGIPEGKENSIFERFYSERPKDEKFGTHSGLGLSISRQIVEAHGGTLHAENLRKPDGGVAGARFVIRLPYGGES